MNDVYRVSIGTNSNFKYVSVVYLGMEVVDDQVSGEYDTLELLPEWVRSRIATLSMLSCNPPTETVEGVGRRITKNTYWVQKPDS
jgi:hypothetical protein